MIVVATKFDATTDKSKLEELRGFCKKRNLEFHAISAAAGEGVKELVRGIADALDRIPKEAFEDEESEAREVNEAKDPEAGLLEAAAYEADDEEADEDEEKAAGGGNS
jgi:GTPase involved in cell partitioning and DNA repair